MIARKPGPSSPLFATELPCTRQSQVEFAGGPKPHLQIRRTINPDPASRSTARFCQAWSPKHQIRNPKQIQRHETAKIRNGRQPLPTAAP